MCHFYYPSFSLSPSSFPHCVHRSILSAALFLLCKLDNTEWLNTADQWRFTRSHIYSFIYICFSISDTFVFLFLHSVWQTLGPSQFSSVQLSRSVVSGSLWPHGLQHARPPCSSPTPGVYSNSCPLSRWCHPSISSSVVPIYIATSDPVLFPFMSQ